VSNAYLLTLGSLILVGGSLGDLFGERRIFAIGVTGFGARLAAVRDLAVDRLPDRRHGALQGPSRAALLTPALARP